MRKPKKPISEKTLEELLTEKNTLQDNISKLTDEINEKRRAKAEEQKKLAEQESMIKAKQFEILANTIADKTGLNTDAFLSALDSGNVLVEHGAVPDKDTEDKDDEIQTEL